MSAINLDEITLAQLLENVPEEWRPIVLQYGPVLLAWTAEELWAWLELILNGNGIAAYTQLVKGLDNPQLLGEWKDLNARWATANKKNAEKKVLQREIAWAIIRVLAPIGMALVGL